MTSRVLLWALLSASGLACSESSQPYPGTEAVLAGQASYEPGERAALWRDAQRSDDD